MSRRDRLVPRSRGARRRRRRSVSSLLRCAANDGIDALSRAKIAAGAAPAPTASTRASRRLASLGRARALGRWELTPNSKAPTSVDPRRPTTSTPTPSPASSSSTRTTWSPTASCCARASSAARSTRPAGRRPRSELATKPSVVLPVSKSGLTTELPELRPRRRDPRAHTQERARRARVRGGADRDSSFSRDRPARIDRLHVDLAVLRRQPRHRRRDHAEHRSRREGLRHALPDDRHRARAPRHRHRRQRRRARARLARGLPREPLAVRERRQRPAAEGRADPGPAAARGRPHCSSSS